MSMNSCAFISRCRAAGSRPPQAARPARRQHRHARAADAVPEVSDEQLKAHHRETSLRRNGRIRRRRVLGLSAEQKAALYSKVFVPIDLNKATARRSC